MSDLLNANYSDIFEEVNKNALALSVVENRQQTIDSEDKRASMWEKETVTFCEQVQALKAAIRVIEEQPTINLAILHHLRSFLRSF